MKTSATAIAAVAVLLAGAAGAQCLGDADFNGLVGVNEAIIVVNNLLNGCPGGPDGCPYTFTDNIAASGTLCAFSGSVSGGTCHVDGLQSFLDGDGSVVVLVFKTDPIFGLIAQPLPGPRGAHEATLVGWSAGNFSDRQPLSGTMTLAIDGRSLSVNPATSPFTIEGCEFGLYTPAYDGLINRVGPSAAAAAAAEDWSAAAAAILRQMRPTRPNLNFIRQHPR